MKNVIGMAVLLVSLWGCASAPDRVESNKVEPNFNNGKSVVYILQGNNKGLLENVQTYRVNGEPTGKLLNGSYTWFYAEPGEKNLEFYDPLIPSRLFWDKQFTLKQGQTVYLYQGWELAHASNKLTTDMVFIDGNATVITAPSREQQVFKLAEISQEDARMLMKKLSYVSNDLEVK